MQLCAVPELPPPPCLQGFVVFASKIVALKSQPQESGRKLIKTALKTLKESGFTFSLKQVLTQECGSLVSPCAGGMEAGFHGI